jgi:phospholipid/cholesterol/gamma-HCH transport system substrate-binding protein
LKEEIKAGIIVVTSLVILSGFIILIGGSEVFEKFDKYYIKVMNAGGLERGSQVRLGGVRVGRVVSVKPPTGPGESVTIEIGVKKGTVLYKGTKASITQAGFVGDLYLLLSVNETKNEKISPGETIPAVEQVQLGTLMAKVNVLANSVNTLINDTDKLFSRKNLQGIETLIGNTNNAILTGSSNLDKVASGLKVTTDKLVIILNEVEALVRGNKSDVSQLIRKAREDIDKAGDMIKSIESTAKSVEKTSKSADRVINIQSRNLESLVNSMTKTTEELQELLQELKNRPWSIIYKEKGGE